MSMAQKRLTSAARLSALALAVIAVSNAEARITRIEIKRVESPTFEGRSFGSVGPYEKLIGRAYGEVDPNDRRNAVIVDIANAPKNARGNVEYSTDFYILKPVNLANGNHRLLYGISNRGSMVAYAHLNEARFENNDPTKAADAGNAFLMRQGYTILDAGWDPLAAPGGGRFSIQVPIATNRDGSPIVGPAMEEFIVDDAMTMTGNLTYPAATMDKSKATLMVRIRYQDEPTTIPADAWEYVDQKGTAIRLVGGAPFKQGSLYTFVYQAKDPIVAGLGFAAIRDVGAFFRHAQKDDSGTPNPIAGDVRYAYSGCVSQPCRALHDFLWLGFNEDESGRKVVDGINNWIGGSSGVFMNYRFAQPGRTQRQRVGRWFPEFQMPFTNQIVTDPATGKRDGRMARCNASNTCPKIFESNSANEYWGKNMAVGHVDNAGKDRTDEPANVRNYFLASLPHISSPEGKGICQQTRNSLNEGGVIRALFVAMDEWVANGTEPPASRIPSVAKGTLVPPVPQSGQGFPTLPGVIYNGRMHDGDLFDFGPKFSEGILTVLPPKLVGTPYPALVPKTDADGNDIAGIRVPDVAVPVATYTGWALRAFPPGADEGCDGAGQQISFAKTKAERMANGDPRLSLEERYSSHDAYVNAVTAAANDLKTQRLLLDEDVQRHIQRAQASSVGR